jgi:hypothetical protein
MAKKVIVDIDPKTGALQCEFDGYEGNDCFTAADALNDKLREFGLELETQHVDKKKTENELRKLPNTQSTGVR